MIGLKYNCDVNTFPYLNAWEAGHWLGLPIENVLAGWEDGTLPAPHVLVPLRWHEDDLISYMGETQQQGETNE